jgi:UDP-xylose/UDP-N-acetylglucosamine transporter B4
MVTVGIFMATLASASNAAQEEHTVEPDDQLSNSLLAELLYMGIGILLLVFALFMSSLLGIYQEVLYKEHGKHPKEAMFYTHAIPLLWFLFLYPDLSSRVSLMNKSDPVGLGTIVIPVMFIYLFMNGLTQYICIRGVFILTSECSSLVVTLVITLRKFISLLFSIFFFQNPFTIYHWMGTILVFGGTAIFTGLLQSIVSKISSVFLHTTKDDKQD